MPNGSPDRLGSFRNQQGEQQGDRRHRRAQIEDQAGETSHNIPKAAGITTAAMWLIEKLTPAVEAISLGSAIF